MPVRQQSVIRFEAEDAGRKPGDESLPSRRLGRRSRTGFLICSAHGHLAECPWLLPSSVPSLVWIPKYRKRLLKGDLKDFLAKRLGEITEFHPEVQVEQCSIQLDHVHVVAVIPPRYAVSAIVGKIKANTSREIRQRFPWVKKVYWRNEFWSVGFFSSTVGIDEAVIKRYVEFQEKVDKGQLKLQLDFGFWPKVPRA